MDKEPILYVVGTPIGNLGDISPRALETLRGVDFIAAEDTRVTVKLLNHFEIKKPLVSYFEHNKHDKGDKIIHRILAGESCAVVTDAGMPCISDPGEDLIRQCEEAGIKTVVVPGPSAVISALAVSGLETGRFTFEGFLSVNKKSRSDHLESLLDERRTMIFYEAPHKLNNTLDDLYKTFGNRRLTIARELTKVHEEIIRTDTATAATAYRENPLKGEIVLILEGKKTEDQPQMTFDQAVAYAKGLIADGMRPTDAAKKAAAESGLKKNEIYKELMEA
ncbi:MAG: 16S rRNA (cytidine(1402)-2'-O)-methyltransferase [Ruminococcus sp.]|nr:16S rRNA (cytidine(1402)-2'-O)-methyltransferase [Ruminococcus sp.]